MAWTLVWSERDDVVPGWHDCTQSSALMALVYAGHTDFPLGIYTAAEREALEDADDRPDETGALLTDIDLAVQRRYHRTFHTLPDDSAATFASFLSKRGYAFVVQGTYKNLPDGHTLRRWQPGYEGGHAVCVLTLGNNEILWLDPMATNKYAGDRTDAATVLQFAWDGAQYSRYLEENEFEEALNVDIKGKWLGRINNRATRTAVVANIRSRPRNDAPILMTVTVDTRFIPDVKVEGDKVGDAADAEVWYGGWIKDGDPVQWVFGYAHSSVLRRRKNGDEVRLTKIESDEDEIDKLNAQIADLNTRLSKKDLVFDSIASTVSAKVQSGKAV